MPQERHELRKCAHRVSHLSVGPSIVILGDLSSISNGLLRARDGLQPNSNSLQPSKKKCKHATSNPFLLLMPGPRRKMAVR